VLALRPPALTGDLGITSIYLQGIRSSEIISTVHAPLSPTISVCRVLYAHALVAAPRISLGWLRALAPALGNPRLGMTGIFLQLSRVLPDEYPLRDDVASYLSDELGFGRLLDFGLIMPRVQQLYEWSAHELAAPALLEFARGGALTYAWRFEDREVWLPKRSRLLHMVRRALPPEPRARV
jgi:hypothetical protein